MHACMLPDHDRHTPQLARCIKQPCGMRYAYPSTVQHSAALVCLHAAYNGQTSPLLYAACHGLLCPSYVIMSVLVLCNADDACQCLEGCVYIWHAIVV